MDRRGEDKGDIDKLIQILLKVYSRTTNIPLSHIHKEEDLSEVKKQETPTDNKSEGEKEQPPKEDEDKGKEKGKGKEKEGK